jgi:hypothetical protein
VAQISTYGPLIPRQNKYTTYFDRCVYLAFLSLPSAVALNRAVEVFTAGALEDKAAAAGAHHTSADGSSTSAEDEGTSSTTNGVAGLAALRAVAAKVAQLEELLAQLSPKVSLSLM